jgi:hypothetical protein
VVKIGQVLYFAQKSSHTEFSVMGDKFVKLLRNFENGFY